MKISIITACFNAEKTIRHTIESVLSQGYDDIQYIVVDGASTDGTIGIVKQYKNQISKIISEPDSGIYEALNKGVKFASGDVIGFLHADDIYANKNVIENVTQCIEVEQVDSCYGDLVYIDNKNQGKIIRYWQSCAYERDLFKKGWMPPHPTFFVKKIVYDKYGNFYTELKIAADYDLVLRFLYKHRISTYYLPEVLVKMRVGGKSNRSLRNILLKSKEDYLALKENGVGGLHTLLLKNIIKIPQFFRRV